MYVISGKAFVGAMSDELTGVPTSYLVFHAHFLNQRFVTKPVLYKLEPELDESFMIDLHGVKSSALGDLAASLVALDEPIHLIVMRHYVVPPVHGTKAAESSVPEMETSGDLFASLKIEWRRSLCKGGVSIATELPGVGQEAKMKVPVGVLDLRIDFVPELSLGSSMPQSEVTKQLKHEIAAEADAQRQFYQYARVWWEEYLQADVKMKVQARRYPHENNSLMIIA
jgi:hypothetical protein